MSKPAELYACLYAPEFPAQALLRFRPELHDRACAVMHGEPPAQEVCALNRKAREIGMMRGMTQVEVDTFDGISVLQRAVSEELSAKAILLECAAGFSPRVEDRSEDQVFLCVIDIAGTKGLFGSPETLARNLLTRASALGFKASVAVSVNFHAAVAVAKAPLPLSVRAIPAGDECTALAELPVSVIDLTEEEAETLTSWGIRTLGMLAALPEKELISRIGQHGKHLRQLARGELLHTFQPVEPVFRLSERIELDSPVEVLDALMFVANLMLEQMILRASARVLALASVCIALTLEGGTTHQRTVRSALPSNDRQLWIKLLHLDLEAHPPKAAVLAVSLDAEPGCTSNVQLGMFSPQLPEPSRLDVTLARIRAIVGEENVGRAVIDDTNRWDGFRMEPFSIPSAKPVVHGSTLLRSARRMLRPPEAAYVLLQDARPKTLVFRDQRYVVKHAYGPWLTAGDWWAQTQWKCEQWDLVADTPNGMTLCCCLVCDLLREQWQMVAIYD
jgi:protein ImuB